jgi:uncharacterized coiled-coil protein SlyX
MVDRQARKRIQALEERAAQRDRELAELSSTVSQLTVTVEAIRASSPRLSPAPSAPSVSAAKPQAPPSVPSTVALPPAPAGFAFRRGVMERKSGMALYRSGFNPLHPKHLVVPSREINS